jgi:hypothetical protein
VVLEVEIAEYLEDNAHGTVGTNIFIGYLPDSPTVCRAIFSIGGGRPVKAFSNGSTRHIMDRSLFQVYCRDTSYNAARTWMNAVRATLEAVAETTIENIKYHSIDAVNSEPATWTDEQGKKRMTQSYQALKERS